MVLGDCPGFEMRVPSFFSDGNAGLCFGNNHLGLPRECQAKAFQPVRLHELSPKRNQHRRVTEVRVLGLSKKHKAPLELALQDPSRTNYRAT